MQKVHWLSWFGKTEGRRICSNRSLVKADLDFSVRDLSCADHIDFVRMPEDCRRFALISSTSSASLQLIQRLEICQTGLWLVLLWLILLWLHLTEVIFTPLWVYAHVSLLSHVYLPKNALIGQLVHQNIRKMHVIRTITHSIPSLNNSNTQTILFFFILHLLLFLRNDFNCCCEDSSPHLQQVQQHWVCWGPVILFVLPYLCYPGFHFKQRIFLFFVFQEMAPEQSCGRLDTGLGSNISAKQKFKQQFTTKRVEPSHGQGLVKVCI